MKKIDRPGTNSLVSVKTMVSKIEERCGERMNVVNHDSKVQTKVKEFEKLTKSFPPKKNNSLIKRKRFQLQNPFEGKGRCLVQTEYNYNFNKGSTHFYNEGNIQN